jgi:small subunit ribosomal protein S4
MARYRGPKAKIARRFKEPIFGPKQSPRAQKISPLVNTAAIAVRSKPSNYAIQLMEKQKAKYTYGLLEASIPQNCLLKATRRKGVTGEIFLQLLESRLDNTVYRMGFAATRRAARQLVSHKHVKVNGRIVDVPSCLLRAGDIVEIREKSKSLEIVKRPLLRRLCMAFRGQQIPEGYFHAIS